jgi:hypothetical protein
MGTSTDRIAAVILAGMLGCHADWKALPLPPLDSSSHDPIWSIAAHGGALWATTPEGMFRSLDSGKTWSSTRPPGFPRDARFPGTGGRLFSAAGCLYATAATGLFSTCDNGSNWKRLNRDMGSIERLKGDAKRIMAGAADGVPRLSEDKGATWRTPPPFFQDDYGLGMDANSLFQDGSLLYACGWNACASSYDSGRTWGVGSRFYDRTGNSIPGWIDRKLGRLWSEGPEGLVMWDEKTAEDLPRGVPDDPQLGYFRASGVAVVGKTLFTSGSWGGIVRSAGVYMSTDTGKTWQARNEGLPSYTATPGTGTGYYVDSVFAIGNILFARGSGPGGVLYRSTDLGAHWTHSDEGLAGAGNFVVHGNRIFALGSDQAGHWSFSDDTGRTWSPWNEDNRGILAFSSTAAFEIRGDGGPYSQDTLLVSRDGMKTWQTLRGPWAASTGPYPDHLFASGKYVLAGYEYLYQRYWFSRDEGRTWEPDSVFLTQEGFHLQAQIGNTIFKTDSVNLLASRDQGQTWAPSLLARPAFTALVGFGKTVFAITGDSLYASSDAGTNWGKPVFGKGEAKVFALDTLGGRLYAATERGLWSTRDGAAWTEAPGAGLYSTGLKAIAASGSNLVLATRQGLFRSPDWGAHWSAIPAGPPTVRSLAYRQGRFFADSWEAGLWSSSDSGKSWALGFPSQPPGEYQLYGRHLGMAAGFQSLYLSVANGFGVVQSIDTAGAKGWSGMGKPNDQEDAWSLARGANAVYACDGEGSYSFPLPGGLWSAVKLPGSGPHDFVAGDGQTVAAASGSGVSYWPASASDWQPTVAGMPKDDMTALAVADGRLYAGLFGNGLWVDSESPVGTLPRPDGPLLSSRPRAALGPDGSALFRVEFARPARVRLELFGISGRTSASVDRLAAAGALDLRVRPRDKGVAFYRLTVAPKGGNGEAESLEGKLANIR